jgi:lysosomal Pro-X carboxypeptidase
VVSRTAAHYSAACAANIRAAFPLLDVHGTSPAFRTQLKGWLGLCSPLETAYDVSMLHFWVRDAFDSLAMGNYPFATDYIGGSYAHPLPPYPVRDACSHLADSALAGSPSKLFPALRLAVAVLYNATGGGDCFDLPAYPTSTDPVKPIDGIWDWQW